MPAPQDLVTFCAEEHPRLLGSLTLYTGDRALAEEIAQEALTRVCARWSTVRTLDRPGAWAHRVALNLAKSRFRRRALERRVAARADEADNYEHDTAQAVVVRQAVARLPTRQREAVVLRHFLGFTVEDAAEVMGVTPGALRSLTHRATGQLEQMLTMTEEDEGTHV